MSQSDLEKAQKQEKAYTQNLKKARRGLVFNRAIAAVFLVGALSASIAMPPMAPLIGIAVAAYVGLLVPAEIRAQKEIKCYEEGLAAESQRVEELEGLTKGHIKEQGVEGKVSNPLRNGQEMQSIQQQVESYVPPVGSKRKRGLSGTSKKNGPSNKKNAALSI